MMHVVILVPILTTIIVLYTSINRKTVVPHAKFPVSVQMRDV